MTVSRTYGDMYNRIADELWGRTDLLANATNMATPPIQLAIQDAIKQWERERWYFNEIRTTSAFATVAAQEFYTSSDSAFIGTLAHIDKMSITVSGNRLYLEPRTIEYMEDISMNPLNTGQPIDYSYYAEAIRFYPIPDAAYNVNVMYTKRFAELVNSGDTNAWMSDGEELIRLTAKMILYRDELRDVEGVANMERAIWGAPGIPGAYTKLKAETARRVATSRIKPTYF